MIQAITLRLCLPDSRERGRNRLIYAFDDYAIVVASDSEKGGTWTGTTEALKAKWQPVFACQHDRIPFGNKKLIELGALPSPYPFEGHYSELPTWLHSNSHVEGDNSEQLGFFANELITGREELVTGCIQFVV